jgi:hypothetical protein
MTAERQRVLRTPPRFLLRTFWAASSSSVAAEGRPVRPLAVRSRILLLLFAGLLFGAACAPAVGTTPPPPTTTPPAATTPAPTPTAVVASPSPSPSTAPSVTYLDDRSTPAQLVRSYYDAIGRRQYARAYSYWEPSATLPAFDVFQKGFAGTTAVQVEIGTITGDAGAGQLYWTVPVTLTATTATGVQRFNGSYVVHLAQPDIQSTPPFKPMAIQSAQITEVRP